MGNSETNYVKFHWNEKKIKLFTGGLFRWFESYNRHFSWRETRFSPYQVLILEIMLQRTPAERVQKILERFFYKYPNPDSIHKASEAKIKSDVKTLGLQNRRTKQLKKIAAYIVEKTNGQIPANFADLLKIPGVGIYVANAVLCFSYNQQVPLVDTNIARVFGRILNLAVNRDPSRDRNLWIIAGRMLPKKAIKQFNWALIDLGSLVCRPRQPLCGECPVSSLCNYALAKNDVA